MISRTSLRYRMPLLILLSLFTWLLATPQTQEQPADTSRRNALRIFMDCQGCDMNFIREEMPYVNFVRDVREAQVYLQITRQSTGSGGSNYMLFYTGQENFTGMRDTVRYESNPDNTSDVTRRALTNNIEMGLMRYVVKTSLKENIMVNYQGVRQEQPEELEDNWNFWVFDLETSPDISLEKREERYSWRNNIRANRVTPDWKIQNSFNHNYSNNVFYRDTWNDETQQAEEIKIEAVRKSWSFSNLTVKSLSPHWSTGFRAGASSSSYGNIELRYYIAPSVEYNIFPYSESNQREITFLYGFSFSHNDYADSTVYDMIKENLIQQSLRINLRFQQRWGSARFSVGAQNYMHDFEKNSIDIYGNIRIRLLRGLSLNVNGGVEFIHDQVELAKGGRSAEDVYLRLRELETNYRYDFGVGISYTFGSIYNNVVNTRF